MKRFEFARASDPQEAVALVAGRAGAAFLGGGTNLVDHMKLGIAAPDLLVDVTRLPLNAIEELEGGGLRIGATVRNSDLSADALVRERYPVLSEALVAGASGQLRNLATVGGNLLQRTRCPYFQDASKPCNKRDPGSGCPAREGWHRNLAILGHSEACVATHPSDMAVAMAAIGAQVQVQGPGGERTLPIPGLHRLPGDEPQRDTVLEPGELICAVTLAPPLANGHSRYRKVRERTSFAFALVSVAAVVDVVDGVVRDCQLALGGVAHVPWRAKRAEAVLRGSPAVPETFARAADAELAAARPLRDNGYKVPLLRRVLVQMLTELCG
jgi:xanthine dehydrogenase YagS FAD-binding subunit